MSANCQAAMDDAAVGVAAALRAVDCTASEVTAAAFGRLFAPGGTLGPALIILLTLFVAFFAIALMLGRANLSVRSLVPRMVTLGIVLTFATSWLAYQSVVWNLAIGAPDYLASVLTGSNGSATTTFADKIDIVFAAVEKVAESQPVADKDISAFSPIGILWLGALLLLLGTVGVLVTARIALAVLVGLGPIFVVLALFNGTRGLFTGWLKSVTMLALTPLFAVLAGSVMLELAVPILAALAQSPNEVDPRAAMGFFVIGAVHVALMFMVLKVSSTMVAGWRVFGLVPDKEASRDERRAPPAPPAYAQTAGNPAGAAVASAAAPSRQIPLSGMVAAIPANDSGPAGSPATQRETRIYATTDGGGQVQPLTSGASRTRGIGNRFKSAKTSGTKTGEAKSSSANFGAAGPQTSETFT